MTETPSISAPSASPAAPKPDATKRALELRQRLEILEAERMILTIQLRNELLRRANELLPLAVAQAQGKRLDGKKTRADRPGSPALLRWVSRMAMKDVRIDRLGPGRKA